ncbi:hypothetical protein EDD18DRAFT_1114698 [Armillaria luteobubalina]|uniref:Uncharacterized protein n=1 Tax=Armillaria luteobubalina TaxID=153913 RepID=A0AA39UCP6_9AGAR|nr:hypothetical protein EDD18DRAFT_1114698 [Armillaria luteobubalina]
MRRASTRLIKIVKECKNLEKRAVRAEGTEHQTQETLNHLTLKYHEPWCQRRSYAHLDQAQSKTQNTEESLTQLMHMHHHALARLKNTEESIDGLKDDLKDARNGDWYFWDFVNELRCGICNKDLDGAYSPDVQDTSLACGDTFHGTCLWQWFEENEGPFYNCKVVNLLQMLGSEEERPASYDWEILYSLTLHFTWCEFENLRQLPPRAFWTDQSSLQLRLALVDSLPSLGSLLDKKIHYIPNARYHLNTIEMESEIYISTRYDYVRVQMCSSSSDAREPNTHAIISLIMLGTLAQKDRVENATRECRGKYNGLGDITKRARRNHQVLEAVDTQHAAAEGKPARLGPRTRASSRYDERTVLETNVSDVPKHLHQELNTLDIKFSILKDETLQKYLQERMLREKHRRIGSESTISKIIIQAAIGSEGGKIAETE